MEDGMKTQGAGIAFTVKPREYEIKHKVGQRTDSEQDKKYQSLVETSILAHVMDLNCTIEAVIRERNKMVEEKIDEIDELDLTILKHHEEILNEEKKHSIACGSLIKNRQEISLLKKENTTIEKRT